MPHAFPPAPRHRRNSMDSASASSIPYGGVTHAHHRRNSMNGGLIRSPSSASSVVSRLSSSSGLTAQSAPAYLSQPSPPDPGGWNHHRGGPAKQSYPAIRPPPLPAAHRRNSCGGSTGFVGGSEKPALLQGTSRTGRDPFFTTSAFGHSTADPFGPARRASLF
jgi:hypothetical protein